MNRNLTLLVFALLFINHSSYTQILFKGETTFEKVIVFTIEENQVFRGDARWSGEAIYSFDQQYFYVGSSTFGNRRMFSFQGDRVFLISQNSSREVLYTIKNNKIYNGNSTFNLSSIKITLHRSLINSEI